MSLIVSRFFFTAWSLLRPEYMNERAFFFKLAFGFLRLSRVIVRRCHELSVIGKLNVQHSGFAIIDDLADFELRLFVSFVFLAEFTLVYDGTEEANVSVCEADDEDVAIEWAEFDAGRCGG